MAKTTFAKVCLLTIILLQGFISYSQTFKNFTIRYNTELKGDMLVVGNNILGIDKNLLKDNTTNESVSMQYINIDNDTSTFNSSSADLAVPNNVDCFRIAYAGLYWGALIKTGDSRIDIDKIKFKTPESSTYTDLTGIIIYNDPLNPIDPDANKPYACYADVTSIVSALTNPQGTYTVANVQSSTGSNGTTGLAAGWTLYVIYENPKTTTKYMVSYDGFSALYDASTLNIDVGGFQTPPSGPINLKFGFAALNGDKSTNNKNQTKVEISNGTANGTSLETNLRPSNYFFNSSITNLDSYITSRNPNGTNSLGYDTGIEQLLNVNKSTIGNSAKNVRFTLQVAKGQANPIFSFFNTFQVNVIAPDISLTKIVEDASGNDIGNTTINLGQDLYYKINFQNTGNDNVTNFILKDVLPKNVVFNYPSDITSLPTGVTHTYDHATRELLFTIPPSLVKIGDPDPINTIRLHVKVVSDYNLLSDACSNEIKNQAFATYRGEINTNEVKNEGSFNSTTCNFGTGSSTNFLTNIDGHTFTRTVQLCNSAVLTASNGYDSYSWSTSPTGTPVVGTSQNFPVTETGTYYVSSISNSTCKSIQEEITVIPYGNITNPVIPYADEVVICPNNGKELPYIFLCGANATKSIQTNIAGATIVWEKLNESSCGASTLISCANESPDCTWIKVGEGANYLVNTSGQFRVTINSGGCFSRFYFNVYQNILNPTETHNDIICNTPGKITVGGVPDGYEYALSLDSNGVIGTYQTSNIFTINSAGSYTAHIRQVGVATNPCDFTIPNILIRKRNFIGSTIVSQPLCNGDLGTIRLVASDVRAQYYYSIYQGTKPVVPSVGPIAASDYEFAGLNPGIYTVRVWTDDGCDYTADIEIIDPPLLKVTASPSKALTCVDGEITINVQGGKANYNYYVNGAEVLLNSALTSIKVPVPTAATYNIKVVDVNNCETTTSITVAAAPTPTWTVSQTNIKCYGDTNGEIKFDVTAANGYTIMYSIDNGINYNSNKTFSNLAVGTYTPVLKYSLTANDGSVTNCFDTKPAITITAPSTALTASAGVSELAGCGPNGEGTVRVTNPEGGTPFAGSDPYLYSFDNQNTWGTTKEADLMPGTYTVYVKDANGCIYPMIVILDSQPPAPTIEVVNSAFNCDGTTTSTVTVTNDGDSNYVYEYLLDGSPNLNTADPKVFLNVPSGSYTVSVNYKLLSVPTYSNLLKEDFGNDASAYTATSSPDASSPGINPAFCWERQIETTKCNGNKLFGNGEYTVTSSLRNNPYGGWHNPIDHTSGSATGRYLAVDAGNAIPDNAVLYRKTIKDIIPNQPIQVRFFATNLLKTGNTQPDASLTVELQNSTGTPLSSSSTGGIPKTNGWVEYNRTINPGDNTTLDFVLRLEVAKIDGIDFAVDDIEVYQLPKSCTGNVDFPIFIPPDKAFTAAVTGFSNLKCLGSDDGKITIAAENFNPTYGFDYSKDNGSTWVNSKTSPVTITGLAAQTYPIVIRYDNTAGTCSFDFSQAIAAPTAVTASASIVLQATCTTGATIRAVGAGGTPAYQYELRQANGTTVITAFNNNPDFTNVPAGSYTVFVRDANGCINATGAAVPVVAPPAVTATLDAVTDYCYTTANPATLVVNVSGGVGPFTYQLDSNASVSSPLTTYSFANVTPGTHTVLVTDSNNCTSTIPNIVIAPALTFNVSLLQDLTCLVDASIGNPVITGGYGPLETFTVSYNSGPPATVTAFPYTATQDGSYVFTVTDSRGCTASSNAIIVTPRTTPTHTTVNTDISCNGLNNGTITVTPSGGFTTTYTYVLSGPIPTRTQTTNQFTNLPEGLYNVNVIDSKGCPSVVTQVTIINPAPIVVSASATPFICSPTNVPQSAVVTIGLPTGGTGTYLYSFNGGSFTSTNTLPLNNGTASVSYQVRDSNGCLSPLQTINLQPLNSPIDLTFSNAAVTCTNQTTTVSVTATNGVGALRFEIIGTTSATTASNFGPVNTTGSVQSANFPDLLPGNYTFRVTDANGCYYTESHNIAPVTPIAVAANKTSDVLCQGGSTGSGTFTVSGNATVGAFTYTPTTFSTGTLTKSNNVLTLSNVAAGTYTVRVTDTATGCFADGTITITEPTDALAITNTVATNFNCNNYNAQITVTAFGGTTAYRYAFAPSPSTVPTSPYASSNVVTVDTNGGTILTWDVYVRDANGCVTSTPVTVAGDPAPGAPTVSVPNQCTATGSGFTIQVTAAPGSLAPLTYGIVSPTGAFQASNTFTVAPGSYTVYVKDRNGCVSIGTDVTVAQQLTAIAAVTKTLDCTATPNAIITTTINGGQANYSYTITNSSSTVVATGTGIAGPTFTYSPTVAGTYTIAITDSNAIPCTTTASATVAPITDPTVTAAQVNVSCNGGNDGSVTLTGSGGSGSYTFSNNATTGFTTNPTFPGLAAGTYTFYVRDSKECDNSINVTITEPVSVLAATAVEVPFSCSTANAKVAGTVTINVTTGTGTAPYTYSFNGGAFTSTNVLTLNDNGSDQPYTYTVQDAKGCPISGSGTLVRLNPPTDLDFVPSGPITCATTSISVQLNTTNGVTPLTYTIVSGPVTNITGVSSGNFTGLTPGTYVFRVTDANGCYYSESYTVAPVTPIVATATKLTDVDCFGNSTGSIRYSVSGFGSGTYSYTVNGGAPVTGQNASNFNLTVLAAGTYVVVFTDNATGCTSSTSITINQPTAALSATYTTVNANCSVPTSRVTVTVAGGTPSFRYSFVTSPTTPGAYGTSNVANLDPLISTTWYAHIIDANNCTFRLTLNIASDPIPTVTASATGQCLGSGTYTITATNTTPAAGIITPIRYSINNGASYQVSNTFTITTAGTYIITMIDGNGCIATAPSIIVAPQLTLTAVLNKDITCSAPTAAQITLTPTGGSGPYTYESRESVGAYVAMVTNVFNTNIPGSYTFRVTDVSGCQAVTTTPIVITTPIDPEITGVTQTAFINCNGDDTAAIAIAIDNTKGQSPFVFNVFNTTTGINYGTQTSGLSAGDYMVTVTDAKGCTDTFNVNIPEPAAIIVAHTSTPITCDSLTGQSKGSVIVQSVTGGVGPYNYFVTGVNGYSNSELNNLGTMSVAFNVVDFGLYQINVVDANGCSVLIQDVPVASPPDDLDISVVPVGPTCVGLGSAEVAIGVASSITGAGPFHFAVYSPGLTYSFPTMAPWYDEDAPGSKKATIPNLIPGVTYTFIVHDNFTGCYYFETADVPIPTNSTITVSPLTPNNITCKGAADGSVTFTMNHIYGVNTPVTYQVYNSQSVTSVGSAVSAIIPASGSLVVTNFGALPFGNYFVLVTEDVGATNAGCSITSAPFNITESAIDLSITASEIKKINCNEDGVIAAFAKDGTAPYTYQYLLDTAPAPIATSPGWISNTTFATGVAGDYIVYVKDAYGCIKFAPVTLTADAPPTISLPAPICYVGTPFTIDLVADASASAGILPATYSINGSAFQSSPSFTFNASGTYNLVIKDGNGCTATVPYEVYPQLGATAALTKPLDCTASPDAIITINTTGGNTVPGPANYTYQVSVNGAPNVAAVNPYTATASGTYVFTVTDANNATSCTTTASITLDAIPVPTLTPTVTNVLCNGGSDGTITVDVTGGVGPFTYTLASTPANTTGDASGSYTGLPYGTTYEVTVTDSNGCTYLSGLLTVDEPTILTATDTFTANTSCSPTTVITVSAFGGTPSGTLTGYTYNFEGLGYTTDNTYTVNNTNTATTVNYTVKDANGCETAAQAVITPALNPPTEMDITGTPIYCLPLASQTSTVTINSVHDGITPFTYQMLSPSVINNGNINSFAGLIPGDYMFQVTDANGCTYQKLYTVADVTPIAIVGALVNDITCNPANGISGNGSARYTVTGVAATSTYSYTINSGAPFTGQTSPTIDLTSLGAGTYTVTVTDETTLCQATDAVTITEPAAITFTTATTKVFCSQDISQITVSAVSGGTGVYMYAVQTGGTATPPAAGAYINSPILSVDTNLVNLSWDVYVKDANGCVAMQNVIVVSDAAPTIVAPAAQCYVGTALTVDLSPNTITITITTTYNGINKTYTVNGSVVAGPTVTLNIPGTYILGIRDDNGCEDFVNYTVVDQVIAGAVLVKDLTCAAPTAATIDVTISGGTGPFTVQMLVGGVSTGALATGVTGPIYTANPTVAGIYSFEITDSATLACSIITNTVEVTTPVMPAFTTVATDATCNGDSNGTITVTPTEGVAPFTFDLIGAGSNPTGDATGFYTGLPAGSYTVVITDAKGCTSAVAAAIVIDEPAEVTVDTIVVSTPLSCGAGNVTQSATVTAQGLGGNGSYQYNFNNQGWTTDNFYVTNTAGPVSVLVRDTNLCTVSAAVSITVDALDPPTEMDITGTPIYCVQQGLGDVTSTVTINSVTNGVGPFTYQILSPSTATGNSTGASSGVFTGLSAGDYLFQVTDDNGCIYQELYTVAPRVDIAAAVTAITDETCFNTDNGTAIVTVSNSAGYTATLTVGTGTFVISGNTVSFTALVPGNYTLEVTDSTTGCTAAVDFSIAAVAAVLDFTTTATNINCDVDTATITVNATGGTPNYMYAVALASAPAPAVTAYGLSNTLVVDTNNGADMNWIVYVMDANGCPIDKPQAIVLDASPVIASVVADQCPSPTGTYDITVAATGFGTLQYSADGSNYQTGSVITVNAAGSYTITVKDANGCVTTALPVTIVEPLILTPTVTVSPSCVDGDGEIAVATTGGSGNYEYRIDSGVYPMATPFTGIASGSHTIFVRDTTTGCEVSTTVTLQPATPITGFSLNTTPVTCNGGNDGTITATLATPAPGVNDNPVYTYVLNGTTVGGVAVSRPSQDSPLFSALEAGTYTVVVTSGRACTATQTIDVLEPALIVVPAPTVVEFGCTTGNVGNLATITVTGVTGGTTPYLNYEFIKIGTPNTQVQFSTNNMYTEADLAGGSYIVNVYDSKGCIGTTTAPITITAYTKLDKINVAVITAIDCNDPESIVATAVDAAGNTITGIDYVLTDVAGIVPSQTSVTGVFTALPIGNYIITVSNPATGCSIQTVHYVNNPNTFDLIVDSVVDVTCFDGANGSANVTFIDRVINATNPDQAEIFDYTVKDALGNLVANGRSTGVTEPILNLKAGIYTVDATLVNSPFCSTTKNFSINQPSAALAIAETHTEITCVTGNNDGTISVAATGGWQGGYEYQLLLNGVEEVPYGTQREFMNLTAGNYTVNVRDSKGCVDFVDVTLVNPTPIAFTASPSVTRVSCFGDTSENIEVTTLPTGGSGNYLYTLITTYANGAVTTNGPQASNVFPNLGAASYQVQVTDTWGCSTVSATPIIIAEPTKVVASLVVKTSQTCETGFTLTLTASGGIGPYTYSSDGVSYVTPTFNSSVDISFPKGTVGTYHYYVKDANDCISYISNDIKIDPLEPLKVNLDVQNAVIYCKGDATGVIVADATGGLGNYVYTLIDGTGNPIPAAIQTTPGRFDNLLAGFYQVKVESGDCEVTSIVVEIEEPDTALTFIPKVTNISCNGAKNGKIEIIASGGTGRIQYAISPRLDQFFDSGLFENLVPGDYQVVIQDQNGCFAVYDFEITEPLMLIVSTIVGSEVDEICAGDKDAAFSIEITGGTAPYSVSLDDVNGTYTPGTLTQTDFDFTGLNGGNHFVFIRDANGCTTDWLVALPEAINMNPSAVVEYDCVGNAAANSVTITIDASITDPTDVDYALDGSGVFQAANVFANLAAGSHFITARHSNGCEQMTLVFEIVQIDPLTLVLNDGGLNEIVAATAGGGGNYKYTFNGEDYGSTANFIIYKSGDYTVTVTDAYGCVASATRYFEYIDVCVPNNFTPNGDGINDNWAPGCTVNYKNLTFEIFDRYGRKVGNYRLGQYWDGKYNGTELPSGDYWYVFKLNDVKDPREFVGHFTLYR